MRSSPCAPITPQLFVVIVEGLQVFAFLLLLVRYLVATHIFDFTASLLLGWRLGQPSLLWYFMAFICISGTMVPKLTAAGRRRVIAMTAGAFELPWAPLQDVNVA